MHLSLLGFLPYVFLDGWLINLFRNAQHKSRKAGIARRPNLAVILVPTVIVTLLVIGGLITLLFQFWAK